MEYVRLGSTGVRVSRICLGMMTYGDPDWRDWTLGLEQTEPFVERALELGINFFDTADMYSRGVSEQVTGELLSRHADREDVVIATKVFFTWNESKPNSGGLSRKHIMDAIDGSLDRLGTDYVDLYQIHRWDPDTPIEETMEALHDIVKAGRTGRPPARPRTPTPTGSTATPPTRRSAPWPMWPTRSARHRRRWRSRGCCTSRL